MTTLRQMESQQSHPESSIRLARVIEQITGVNVTEEVYLSAAFVDLYQELPTEKFIEVFGADAINQKTKSEAVQKVVYEVEGPIHDCGPTHKFNIKTTSKLAMLRHLGMNVTCIRSTDLRKAADLDTAKSATFLLDTLKENMNKE